MSKYPDLVKRLRENGTWTSDKVWESHPECAEAADAIEAQAKRIEELEKALKPFAGSWRRKLEEGTLMTMFGEKSLSQAYQVLGDKE